MRFKKCGKILARIVPVICVFALMVSLAMPACAFENLDGLNFEDYIESTSVSSDGKIFYVSLPTTYAEWGQYQGSTTIRYSKSPVSFTCNVGTAYNLNCNVLGGASSGYSTFLRLDNIPDGTSVSLSWNVFVDAAAYETPNLYFTVFYFDSSGSQVSSVVTNLGVGDLDREYTFTLNIPDGAFGCGFQLSYRNFVNVSASGFTAVICDLDALDLVIPVSNYYIQNQQAGKQTAMLEKIESELQNQGQTLDDILESQGQTNEKLDEVVDQQQQTNEKLDEVINGSDEQNQEADDLEDKTDDSLADLDQAGEVLDSVDRPEIDSDSLVPDDLFGDDYLLLVDTIKIFWTSDLITKNLTIMAGFILLALVIHGKK